MGSYWDTLGMELLLRADFRSWSFWNISRCVCYNTKDREFNIFLYN